MPLAFVTGAPGAGKTSLQTELDARGYSAYDTDDPERTGIAGWHNISTGEYLAGFNEVPVTKELLETHIWRLTDTAIADFQRRAENEAIYLCGSLRDPNKVIAISDYIAFLTLPGHLVEARLLERSKVPGQVEWGREQWQREASVQRNQELATFYGSIGAIMIRADQPVDMVVADLIAATTD